MRTKLKRFSETEKLLALSVLFTLVLLLIRVIITGDDAYMFFPWNLFLAALPLVCSRQLKKQGHFTFKAFMLLGVWLLFFPNAPYIITDLFHFSERPPVPYWYDLTLIISGAWAGTAMGFVSLMHVEKFLAPLIKPKWRMPAVLLVILLCSYGIYLGRYLRYNSWDIVSRPFDLAHITAVRFISPWNYPEFAGFTFLFSVLLGLMYFTVKRLGKE